MKELIRRLLFFSGLSEMEATSGTLKFRFLVWLYGEDSAESMVPVIWPEKIASGEQDGGMGK